MPLCGFGARSSCAGSATATGGFWPSFEQDGVLLPAPEVYLTGFSSFPGVPANPTQVLIKRLQRHFDNEASAQPRFLLRCATVLRVSARATRAWVHELFSKLMLDQQDAAAERDVAAEQGAAATAAAAAGQGAAEGQDAAVDQPHAAAERSGAGEEASTPSGQAAKAAAEEANTKDGVRSLAKRRKQQRPVLIVHLGVDRKGRRFKLERQAYNDATFRVPDVDGWRPSHEPIDCELAVGAALCTDLDLLALRELLRAKRRRKVHISCNAGRYICNWTYFLSLHHIEQGMGHRDVHALFVHVPPFSKISEDKQFQFLLDLLDGLAWLVRQPRQHAAGAAQVAAVAAAAAATPATLEAAAGKRPSTWRRRFSQLFCCSEQ